MSDRPSGRSLRRWLYLLIAVFWILLIFGTSCTVVFTDELFAWIGKHVGPVSLERFRVFWGASWIVIVKGWHALEFAVLFFFCHAALSRRAGRSNNGLCIATLIFCIAFAISDEWHQTFVPGRGGTVTDVCIDSVGAITAAIVTLKRHKRGMPP